jgi:DNA-binding SARP family transcriptional activator
MIRVNVLGPLVIEAGGRRKLPKKGRALLGCLAVHNAGRGRGAAGGAVSRERLADLLWPYQQSEQARHSLRNCLLEIRKSLGPDVLAADFTHCRFIAESDLDQFEALAASEDLCELKECAALYRGELLAGTPIDYESWQEWLGPERHRVSEIATAALFRLAKLASNAGDHRTAIANARRVVQIEPFCEVGHRLYMHALAAAGRAPEALQHYSALVELLKAELSIRPSDETQALRQKIKSQLKPGEAEPDHPPPIQLAIPPAATLQELPDQLQAVVDAALAGLSVDLRDLEDLPRQLQAVITAAGRIKGAIEAVLDQRKNPALLPQAA